MGVKYPFPPDFKTIYEKADLLKVGREDSTASDIQIERNNLSVSFYVEYPNGTLSEWQAGYIDKQGNFSFAVIFAFVPLYV